MSFLRGKEAWRTRMLQLLSHRPKESQWVIRMRNVLSRLTGGGRRVTKKRCIMYIKYLIWTFLPGINSVQRREGRRVPAISLEESPGDRYHIHSACSIWWEPHLICHRNGGNKWSWHSWWLNIYRNTSENIWKRSSGWKMTPRDTQILSSCLQVPTW